MAPSIRCEPGGDVARGPDPVPVRVQPADREAFGHVDGDPTEGVDDRLEPLQGDQDDEVEIESQALRHAGPHGRKARVPGAGEALRVVGALLIDGVEQARVAAVETVRPGPGHRAAGREGDVLKVAGQGEQHRAAGGNLQTRHDDRVGPQTLAALPRVRAQQQQVDPTVGEGPLGAGLGPGRGSGGFQCEALEQCVGRLLGGARRVAQRHRGGGHGEAQQAGQGEGDSAAYRGDRAGMTDQDGAEDDPDPAHPDGEHAVAHRTQTARAQRALRRPGGHGLREGHHRVRQDRDAPQQRQRDGHDHPTGRTPPAGQVPRAGQQRGQGNQRHQAAEADVLVARGGLRWLGRGHSFLLRRGS